MEEEQQEVKKSIKMSPKAILTSVVVLLILIGAGGTYYFYAQNQKSQALLKDPTALQKIEVKDVTDKISKLMELPKDEEPQVATVLDKEKLKDQAFFVNAEKDDKVVIYTKANMAILYRPSTNKIINVAALNLGQSTQPVKIAVLNGTKTAGLSTKFATDIVKTATNVTVATKANAVKSDYVKSIVVDLTNKPNLATEMANLIGGVVGSLPEGEVKPTDSTVDLLVILGSDFTSLPQAPTEVVPSPTPGN